MPKRKRSPKEQHIVDTYKTMVRATDPGTSHAAAHSWTRAQLTEVQWRVYVIHKAHPDGLTDEQLLHIYEREYPTAESSPRKRRCDLTRLGLIVDSGRRRPLASGRLGIVWVIAPPRRVRYSLLPSPVVTLSPAPVVQPRKR